MKRLPNAAEMLPIVAAALFLAVLPVGIALETCQAQGTIPGDTNMDCRVNILDLLGVRNKLNHDPESGDNFRFDANSDGKINILDLILVRNHLNSTCSDYARLLPLSQTQLASFYMSEEAAAGPAAPTYSLPLDTDWIDNFLYVSGMLGLDADATGLLTQNGFVVFEPQALPLAALDDITFPYDHMTVQGVPNFVTSDTMLHLYHVQFDEILKSIEEREFFPAVQDMTAALLERSAAQHGRFTHDVEEAAKRNVAFFAVAMKLLDPDYEVPGLVSGDVSTELAAIEAHAGFNLSPIFGYLEDYSQYVPRGHYTRSEDLKKYFKAMMWYGRLGFLLKGCAPACPGCECLITAHEAKIQTIQASLITIALQTATVNNRPVAEIWDRIYNVTAYFVGLADDLTPYNYVECLRDVFGQSFLINQLNDDAKMLELKAELALLPNPEIYGGTGACVVTPPFTPEKIDECLTKSKGMRFMGQRFIPDSFMFQNLVLFDYVGNCSSGCPFTLCITGAGRPARCFPRGLDVMAMLGSDEAMRILQAEGDADYDIYEDEFDSLKELFDSFDESEWNKNLYWSWLYTLKALLLEYGPGYPAFMRTSAWLDKQLNAALASWTELRHDTILYAKQSYTPFETGVPPEPGPGFVEPVPEFYARLLALTRMTRTGLTALSALNDLETARLGALEQILARLIEISVKELEGQPLAEADADFIRDFGLHLQPVLEGVSTEGGQTTIVADVHTDMNTQLVLEEGVGYVHLIAAAYMLPDGRILLGVGPVFSHYEFKWPMADRLTDEAWKGMLEVGTQPARPPWVRSFSVSR